MKSAALALIILWMFPQITYAYCSEVGRTCIEEVTPSTGGPNRECTKFAVEYQCNASGGTAGSQCDDLRKNGCTEATAQCGEFDPDTGNCLFFNKTYTCDPEPTETQTNCQIADFCNEDGTCFDTSYDENKDMGRAIAFLEAARQVGEYLQEGNLFPGEAKFCREGYAGIKRCCKSKSRNDAFDISNQMTSALATSAQWAAAKYAWSSTVTYSSPYIYDTITGVFGASFAKAVGLNAASQSASTLSFSFMGFTGSYQTSAAALESGFLSGSNYSVVGPAQGAGPGFNLVFNPYIFALAALVLLYQYLSSCNEEEEILSLYRGSGSCQAVPQANRCTKKVFGSCLETKKAYCCYNSILAKTLNHTAKRQQGKPAAYGKGRPNCDQITIDDLANIDFSTVNFDEFIDSIEPGGKGEEFWRKKLKSADSARARSQADCLNKPTLEEQAACKDSFSYQRNGVETSFTSASDDGIGTPNTEDFYKSRTQDRINLAADEGRADVVAPPKDHENIGPQERPYYDSEDNKGSTNDE